MEEIVTIVSNLGFPIASFLIILKMFRDEQKSHQEESKAYSESYNELKLAFTEALNEVRLDLIQAVNNNTVVMQKLVDKMGDDNVHGG